MVCSGLAGVDLAAVKRQRWVDNSGGVERRSHYNARYLHRWISTYNIHAHLSSSVVVHTTRSSIWLVSIVRVSRWRADDRDCDDDTADTAHLLLSRCHNSQQCHVSRVTSDHYEYCPIQGPHAASAVCRQTLVIDQTTCDKCTTGGRIVDGDGG